MLVLVPVLALLASCLLEAVLLRPRAAWRRPLACWLLPAGMVLAVYVAGLALFQRPWFAAAQALAWYLFILVVNRVKLAALREPFVFQDFEYFTDLLRHPRLYLPFFGYFNALLGIVGASSLIVAGLWLEPALWQKQGASAYGLAVTLSAGLALFLLGLGWREGRRLQPEFDAMADVRRFGLLASLWLYARAERSVPTLPVGFEGLAASLGEVRPHLLAVQSESFFDARRAWSGISPEVYAWLDQARREAASWGLVTVPAWGANTVRSEFAFLSGLSESALGVHRFNPYRRLRAVKTLARALQEQGYRTVCVHPYAAAFYRREQVFPGFGFDEFVDVRAFAEADRCGPYVGDVAVAERVAELLASAEQPLFVFVITMENHGPLHLEQVDEAELQAFFSERPAGPCAELAVYLRHIRNAGRMWQRLQACLQALPRESRVCWYGDHVPILPREYARAGFEDARTDYFCWSSSGASAAQRVDLSLNELAADWLARGRADV